MFYVQETKKMTQPFILGRSLKAVFFKDIVVKKLSVFNWMCVPHVVALIEENIQNM